MTIKLGQTIKDSITGYQGVAIGRTKWLYGCVRITIQGDLDKDGKVPDTVCFDEEQLIVVKAKRKVNGHKREVPPAGPRADVVRRKDAG